MPHSRTLPTPSIPHPKGVTFYGASTVAAPATDIWSTLLDLPSYPAWNTFTPDPSPTPPPAAIQRGLHLYFTAHLHPPPSSSTSSSSSSKGTKTHVQISHIDPGRRLCWTSRGLPHWALRTERVMEVEDFGDGKCEVRSFETMEGCLVPVVKWKVGATLDEALRRFAEDWAREVGRRIIAAGERGRGGGGGVVVVVVNPERAADEDVVGAGRVGG